MADETWMQKIMKSVLVNGLLGKEQDITLNLEGLEIKSPLSNEPIKLSGKITIQFSSKKKKK
jgi:hypothetical protein